MRLSREGRGVILNTFIVLIILMGTEMVLAGAIGWSRWITIALGVVSVGLMCVVVWFFRDPERQHILEPDKALAPVDGKVVAIERVYEKEYLKREVIQVSIFMSLTNIHANFYPVGGQVTYRKYHPGKYLVAWHPKSSELNERMTIVVDTGKYGEVLFRQIAGMLARRIVNYAVVGKRVEQGRRCGFIKLGSRMDVFLPLDTEIMVKIGDKVKGAKTPIAKL